MDYWNHDDFNFNGVVGLIFTNINGLNKGSNEIEFITNDDIKFVMHHDLKIAVRV